jgi:hypothetical protein
MIQFDDDGAEIGNWDGIAIYNLNTSTWPTAFTWTRAPMHEVDAGTYANAQAGFDITFGDSTRFTKFTMRVESYQSSGDGSAEIRFDNAYAGGSTPVVNAVIKYNTLSKLQTGTFYVDATDGLLHLWVPYATTTNEHLHVNILDCQNNTTNEANYIRINPIITYETTALDLSAITNKVQITLVNKISTTFSFGSGTATVVKQDNVVTFAAPFLIPSSTQSSKVLGTLPLPEYYPQSNQFFPVTNQSANAVNGCIIVSATDGTIQYLGAATTASSSTGGSWLAKTTVGGSTSAALTVGTQAADYVTAYNAAYTTSNGANSYQWYRKYKSGWVEQGGIYNGALAGISATAGVVTLPVAMTNAYYVITATADANGGGGFAPITGWQTSTQFSSGTSDGTSHTTGNQYRWMVSGQAAS